MKSAMAEKKETEQNRKWLGPSAKLRVWDRNSANQEGNRRQDARRGFGQEAWPVGEGRRSWSFPAS